MPTAQDLPSKQQVLRAAERVVASSLPPSWSATTSGGSARDTGADAVWTVSAPDDVAVTYVVDVKRSVRPRELPEIVAQVHRPGARVLVIAPYLSSRAREVLRELGASYVDTTGNMLLVSDRPGLLVDRLGATKDPWPSDDTLRSLRGRGAGRALRALVDFSPPFGVRDLAARAGVPLGSLSRTLDFLDREGFVTRGDRGQVADLDWEGAIRRWCQDYDFARSNHVMPFLEPRGLNALVAKLAEGRSHYAATGGFAAQRFEPIAPARQATLYVDDITRVAESLNLRVADSGANVLLAEAYDGVVFERITSRDGLRVVALSQLAADLLTGTGREPSEGNELLNWMRRNEDAWRA